MLTKSLLTTALLATAAAATSSNFMAHHEMKRELLQPRQTATGDDVSGISTECQTALLDVYSSLPSPPPEVVSDAVQNPQTDPCSFSTPASLSKQYSSYSSEVISWYSKNEGEIRSVLSECSLSQYASMVRVCETGAGAPKATDAADSAAITSIAKPKAAAAASGSDVVSLAGSSAHSAAASGVATSASPSATKSASSGNRDTAMAAAAMAVAGLVAAL